MAMRLLRKKVLITGANGLLGQALVKTFLSDYDVLAVARESASKLPFDGFLYRAGDLADRAGLRDCVSEFVPNYIVNAAAYTNVDGSESDREACWRANVTGVENLAYAARKVNARLIHVSTDYVFDGRHGPYKEDDTPNPLGFYARSKLAGENVLMTSKAHFAIARTMVLYGAGYGIRTNFVTWAISQLRRDKPIRVVDDQFGNPTLASELAAALRTLAESGKTGVFHLSGSEVIDRYSFAQRIAETFGLDKTLISPVHTADFKQPAPRPLKSGFIVEKAERELGVRMSNVAGGLEKFKNEYLALEQRQGKS
jgi:dTDP-4-dehydrorhamnose reductase